METFSFKCPAKTVQLWTYLLLISSLHNVLRERRDIKRREATASLKKAEKLLKEMCTKNLEMTEYKQSANEQRLLREHYQKLLEEIESITDEMCSVRKKLKSH